MGVCSSSKRLLFYAVILATLFALSYHYHLLQTATKGYIDLETNSKETHPCSHAPEGLGLIGAYGRVEASNLILSSSYRAELLFSQGMAHAFAFNPIEGYRNFETALQFDDQCSMCYWGMALLSGPNLNAALDEEHFLRGRAAINSALELLNRQPVINRTKSSPYVRKSAVLMMYQNKAHDLIHALKLRYPDSTDEWREKGFMHFESLYADAMREVHEKYPVDEDITAMYAEAVMNLSPWNVFERVHTKDKDKSEDKSKHRSPATSGTQAQAEEEEEGGEVVMNENSQRAFAILSTALYPQDSADSVSVPLSISQLNQLDTRSHSRTHPLLLHLWIHLLESGPSQYVQAAEGQADLLLSLATEPTGKKLGHLLHMPAHIYDNVGRYDDCITASELAITSDRAYLASCFTPAYDIHNQDILVACAVMGGRLRDALTYAVPAGALLLEATAASAMGTTAMRPYHYTLATEFISPHFGDWETLLAAASHESREATNGRPSVYTALDRVIEDSKVTALSGTPPSSSSSSSLAASRVSLEEYQQQQPFLFATTLYGRCLALVGTGDLAGGTGALALLKKAATAIPAPSGLMGTNNYDYRRDIGVLLVQVAAASLFIARDETAEAIAVLRKGVQLQTAFGYREPASFYLPLRQCLAAALVHQAQTLGAGGGGGGKEGADRASSVSLLLDEAQRLYREDLREHPHNVWSLRGQKSLAALSLPVSLSSSGTVSSSSGKKQKVSSVAEAGEPVLRGTSSCCEIGLC